jgi:hypothetical protein
MFQGHEEFISVNNCFFFCGDSYHLDTLTPWITFPELLEPTLCKVTEITYQFPSKNAIHLLKEFGKNIEPK